MRLLSSATVMIGWEKFFVFRIFAYILSAKLPAIEGALGVSPALFAQVAEQG